MWQRFKRLIRSLLGSFLGSAEDPEAILEQNLRDMEEQVPRMNAQIAMVRANVTLLEKESERAERERHELVARVKAALAEGREDLAEDFALQLESARGHAGRAKAQLEAAQRAYEKALEVRQAFMAEKERKSRQAMDIMRAARQARWQSKVAEAMETFDIAGIDATHDEMVRRIEEQAALDSARLEMALESVDVTKARVEAEAERLRARELLAQFKAEMGIKDAPARAAAAREPAAAKTIGKTRARKKVPS
jgi:phage shock protein A